MMHAIDMVIIGGGPAGLAAAISAKEAGIDDILIIERDQTLGGILNQCIHNGFGLHVFKEELTGPEYAARYIEKVQALNIDVKLNTMVIDVNENKELVIVNEEGLHYIKAKAIVLAMGCRERSRGAINIPGFRPAGIYSAGTAQKYVNLDGYLPGKEVVILGSGDIGLIMARRMTFEGAKVAAVIEIMPHSSGLIRNIVQCLDDFDIPLMLSHTITHIEGKERVTGVKVARVDDNLKPIKETDFFIPCDTVLFSVGLLPENELSKEARVTLSDITGGPIVNESFETNVEGIFACGNVLHVHDLVDFVSEESELAGKSAAQYIKSGQTEAGGIRIGTKAGIRYTVPTTIRPDKVYEDVKLNYRVNKVYMDHFVCVYFNDECVLRRKMRVLMPGEMESIVLRKKFFEQNKNIESIFVTIEEA